MLRVLAEDDRTLPTVIPDGIYGQETITAVSAFQRRAGLPVTGIANQETWDAVVKAYEPALIRVDKAAPIEVIIDPGKVYRRGDSSANLYLLQAMLAFLSRYHTDIGSPEQSGVLDATTAEALAAFQLLAGLPPTGELDKVTWRYLVNQFTLNANLWERSYL
jgi:peptidoglycan hydrolase-like protein with peptidoglycan-binding domain